MPTYAQVRQRLENIQQDHLLRFYNELSSHEQDALLTQIDQLDLESVPALVQAYVKSKPAFSLSADVGPAPYFPNDPNSPTRRWDKAAAQKAGEALIRAGKVAAFTVAGGQGSRLGFDGPKGCYPAGAVTGKPLFQIFAENLLGVQDRYGAPVPWYIMTSPLNHQSTVSFFEQNRFFGLDRRNVMFFPQGVLPSFDMSSGKILLASKGEVATNPDGHGGSIRALHVSGALADMRKRGVEQISYFQVDNPIVRAIDPVFLGLHAGAGGGGLESSGEMSSKMVRKTGPGEKVGVFCSVNGKTEVIEYSDLPQTLQEQTLPDGTLRFIAGSIAIHVMSVEFVQRLATDPQFALPYHRAEKKIPHVNDKGEPVAPTGNNGVKLERFVFDALPLCRSSIVYETDRIEEFAPIKNATGVDSVESSREIQTRRAARWLTAAGVKVPTKADGTVDALLEVSARTATSAEELDAYKAKLPRAIEPGARMAL
ncbi:MAG TPA: UDPGP type 1 family protein [Phycisphaerales bacterium]|nr:UDPGP type 1 family protein [Phycisphaerales bacterium]